MDRCSSCKKEKPSLSTQSQLCSDCIKYASRLYIEKFIIIRDLYCLHQNGEMVHFVGPRKYREIANSEILEIEAEINNLDLYLQENYSGYGKTKLDNDPILYGDSVISFLAHNTKYGFLVSFCPNQPSGQYIHLSPIGKPEPIWLKLRDIRADLGTARYLVKHVKPLFNKNKIF